MLASARELDRYLGVGAVKDGIGPLQKHARHRQRRLRLIGRR
jgi:hypothetical protein